MRAPYILRARARACVEQKERESVDRENFWRIFMTADQSRCYMRMYVCDFVQPLSRICDFFLLIPPFSFLEHYFIRWCRLYTSQMNVYTYAMLENSFI